MMPLWKSFLVLQTSFAVGLIQGVWAVAFLLETYPVLQETHMLLQITLWIVGIVLGLVLGFLEVGLLLEVAERVFSKRNAQNNQT